MKAERLVGIEDFLGIASVSSPRFSPDSRRVAFVVTKPDLGSNGYVSRLWLWERSSGACRELDAALGEPKFLWLDPDRILYPAKPGEAAAGGAAGAAAGAAGTAPGGAARTRFESIDVATGERLPRFELPFAVKRIELREGGGFFLTAPFDGGKGRAAEPGGAGSHALESGRDFEIIEALPIWSDGAGFVRNRVTRLYAFSGSGEPEPITEPGVHVEQFRSRGGKLLFVAKKLADAFESSGLYLYDAATRRTRCLLPQDRYAIAHADFLGDSVVFVGTDRSGGLRTDNPKFYRIEADRAVIWADSDISVRDTVGYDCRYGEATAFASSGGKLYFVSTRARSSILTALDEAGSMEELTGDVGAVQDFDIAGGEAVFAGIRGMGLQELYLLAGGSERTLTDINAAPLAGKAVAPAETMVFEGGGREVHYVVLKPADFDPSRKYPAVLYIHGGAKVLYGPVFFHEMQVLASRGLFVVYGNPRGSDGQDGEFARLQGRYGQRDYEDMMKAMDVALERYPQIDPARLAVAGGSYGGIMTNWIIGHTRRFACAVSDRSICNMVSAFGTADNGYDFVREQMDADPWSDLDKLWEQSPLKYASKVGTPLLLVHSEEDRRCHYSEAIQFFTALRYFGVEARMLFVRGECHDLSRTGRPRQRILRLNEIVGWLEGHLLTR